MEWLDDANKQQAAIMDRERAIVEEEDAVYEALWTELKLHIEAAKERGFPRLFVNGRDQSRVVVLPTNDADGSSTSEPDKLYVTLSKGDHEILAYIGEGHPHVKLKIEVSDGGFVCLAFEDKQISNREAAIRFLWPFLYPDLPPYAGPKQPRHSVVIETKPRKRSRF